MTTNDNFKFVDDFDSQVSRLARQAESYVHTDPESCLFKLRLMIEVMARRLVEIERPSLVSSDLGTMLQALERMGKVPRKRADTMHAIRRDGNAAVHGKAMPAPTAMRRLRDAHRLAEWFCKVIKRGSRVKAAEFVEPNRPAPANKKVQEAIAKAETLENEIETRRIQTREALLLFGDNFDFKGDTKRLHSELDALAHVAAAAGEPLVDAESVVIIMAMELEQLLNDPRFGISSREAQERSEQQLELVKQQLDEREQRYEAERSALAVEAIEAEVDAE